MELIVLCVSFAALLLLGVPVAFAIGLSSVATILAAGLPVAVVFQKMVGGMQVFSFLAIPFFVFAGELMLYGGIAERIVRFANSMVGHVRGGLGMSNVLGCTLFGGIVGSPVADVSAMGSVMIPLMKKEGYDADYAVNVTTHAALVGALMPTSHNLILFTLATSGLASVSVLGLILAGCATGLGHDREEAMETVGGAFKPIGAMAKAVLVFRDAAVDKALHDRHVARGRSAAEAGRFDEVREVIGDILGNRMPGGGASAKATLLAGLTK